MNMLDPVRISKIPAKYLKNITPSFLFLNETFWPSGSFSKLNIRLVEGEIIRISIFTGKIQNQPYKMT